MTSLKTAAKETTRPRALEIFMGRKFSGWIFGGLNFGPGIFGGICLKPYGCFFFFGGGGGVDFYGVRSPPKFMV